MSCKLVRKPDAARRAEALRKAAKEAKERYDSWPAEVQKAHRYAQRKSWVKGEMMLANPDMTEAEFERLWAGL